MTPGFVSRAALAAVLLALGSTGSPDRAADDATQQPGDQWEVTSQMSMEGMPMALPPRKVKVCAPKEWKEPPGATDERMKCTNSDFKIDGAKATWKAACAGPPAMTGDGEIVREGTESWAGAIRFTSSDGAMTLKLSGRRLGGCEKSQ